jgi:hypothetical protein
MTYINAFRCKSGIGMSADTQETIGDAKNYVEKIAIVENREYPLAVGGAGVGDIIEPFAQDIIERVSRDKPSTKADLQEAIRASIKEVYEHDLPFLALKKQHRTPQFLIAAKPSNDNFCIFPIIGRRLYGEKTNCIIGYPSPQNNAMLKRLHSEAMPMQEGVILAAYLVSQSKQFDDGVGGETSIALVLENGVWLEPSNEIAEVESRFKAFMPHVDRLLLAAPNVGLTEAQFTQVLSDFGNTISTLRYQHKERIAEKLLVPGMAWSYEKLPIGCRTFKSEKDGKTTMFIYSDPDEEAQ